MFVVTRTLTVTKNKMHNNNTNEHYHSHMKNGDEETGVVSILAISFLSNLSIRIRRNSQTHFTGNIQSSRRSIEEKRYRAQNSTGSGNNQYFTIRKL